MHADAEAGDGLCRRHKLTGHEPDARSGGTEGIRASNIYVRKGCSLAGADKISRTARRANSRDPASDTPSHRREECVKERFSRTDSQKGPRLGHSYSGHLYADFRGLRS